jgi:hypothetical protein
MSNGSKEILKGIHDNPMRATIGVGWYCGNCKNWHGPQIDTCPKPPVDRRTLREKIVRCDNG